MSNNLNFSVLISVYNKDNPQWLKEAVESVLNNTIKPNEIIVAIDGPVKKEIHDILENYEKNISNFLNVFLPENKGRGEALNKVLPMCKYNYVALVDADDINLPNRFELQLKEFAKNSKLAVVGGYIQEFKNLNNMQSIRKVPLTNEEICKYIKFRCPINQPTVMLNKNKILEIGGYESLFLMEDYLLWVKAVNNKLEFCNIPKVLVNMRINDNLYARRGGYKYFKSSKTVFNMLLKTKNINVFIYLLNIIIRFTVHVLMSNNIRKIFYRKMLR